MSSAKYGGTDLLLGLLNLAGFYFPKGEPQHGRLAPGRRCLQLTQATADPELLATAHHLVGVLAMACGNLREAVSNLDPALAQFDRTEQHISWALFELGAPRLPFRGRGNSTAGQSG
jgi:hypothetical protein